MLRWVTILFVVGLEVAVSSCGRDQQLVSIDIQPQTETFGAANIPVIANAGVTVQLRALGTYIHPPVTKDITAQVTWASSDENMITVDTTGRITATGLACGATLITATVRTDSSSGGVHSSGAIVTGTMTANVVCFTGTGAGTGPTVTVNVLGTGAGTITSTPSGVNCTTTCLASFASGTTVVLNATTSVGSVFGGWSGCDSVSGSGLGCTLNNLTSNRSINVTFN